MQIFKWATCLCLVAVCVSAAWGQDATAVSLSLEVQLAKAKEKLANTWYVDREATSLYVQKHLAGDEKSIEKNNMLKQFATVAIRFTAAGEMQILDRTDLTNQLHKSTFVLTIDDKGDIYLIGQGDGMNTVFSLAFDEERLVLSRSRTPKPSECTVLGTEKP